MLQITPRHDSNKRQLRRIRHTARKSGYRVLRYPVGDRNWSLIAAELTPQREIEGFVDVPLDTIEAALRLLCESAPQIRRAGDVS
jgi:hypothetical protein